MGRRGRPPHPDILTPREWEVLDLLRDGLTNEQIAARLGVTRAGAKYHVSEILSKLGVATREEAAVWQPEPVPVATAGRRWWAGLAWLRPLTAAKLAGATVVVATVAALGVLAWGVWRTSGSEEEAVVALNTSSPAATPAPTPTPVVSLVSSQMRWARGVHLIELTGGGVTRLPALVEPRATFGWPAGFYAVSPTDDRIAVVNQKAGPDSVSRLTVYDGRGAYLTQISLDPLVQVDGLSWSLGGDRLAATGSGRLLIVNPDTGERSELFDQPEDEQSPSGKPSWSPDGQRIAVRLYTGGNEEDLAVVGLGGTVVARVGTQHRGGSAVWSPDGSQIAYDRPNGVYVAAADGSSPGKLLTAGGSPAWSPNGSRIAFNLRDDTRELAVYTIAATGGESTRVAQGNAPVWSPDGARIAFLRDGNVFFVDSDGRNETQVTASPLPFLTELSWSARGDRLLVVYEPGDDSEIHVASSDGSGATALAFGFDPRWSPDGSRIAFLSGFGFTGYWGAVYVMRPDGGGITRLARHSLSDNLPSCYGGDLLAWSPDGQRIAYVGGESVFVVDAGGAFEPLEVGKGFGPAWSPSGDRMAFTARGVSATCAVYSADPADPAESKVLFEDARLPAWSPDGEKIAFVRYVYGAERDVSLEVLIGGADGGKPKVIARFEMGLRSDPYILPAPAWSPDGSQISLKSEGTVYLLDPGGRADPLEIAAGHDPAWFPDGRRLAFTRYEEGRSHIYVADVDDESEPHELIEGRSPDWSPDGTRIAFTR